MNTVNQTIAKLIILPLFGAAVVTGVALNTADSAGASTEPVTVSKQADPRDQRDWWWRAAAPTAPAQGGHAVLDGEIAPSTSAAPARPDVVLNGVRVDGQAPAPAPAPSDGNRCWSCVPYAPAPEAPVAPARVQPMPPAAPAPASKPTAPAQQESGTSDRNDGAKSSKGNSARQ